MTSRRLRWIARSAGIALAGLALAAAASAGPFTGSLSLVLGGLAPVGVGGSGNGTSSATNVGIPGAVFATQATMPGTSPFVTAVKLSVANGAGSFSGATLHGPMALQGSVRLLNGGVTAFTIPLTIGGTRGVGLGGAPIRIGTPASAVTLSAGTWSAGLVQLSGIGDPASPRTVSLAGSDLRTALGAGALTLVTPMRITRAGLGSVAAFGVLQLSFVPEPAAGALLGTAAVALALGVRRRAQRR